MTRNTKKALAVVMSLALAASGLAVNSADASAAAKVKLSATKATIKVGAKKTVSISGIKASNVKKLTLKSSKPAVATVKKNSNVKFMVTGKSAGKSTITAKVTLKKAVAKKKAYSFKLAATVKASAVPAVTAFSDLEKALKSAQAAGGGTVTISSEEEGIFTIAEADYSKVDLIVDAPKADVDNSANFKSITIKAIKASTWTEKAKGNIFDVVASTASRIYAALGASIASVTYSGTGAGTLEVAGSVGGVFVKAASNFNIAATGAGTINEIDVTAKDADVKASAETGATISKVRVEEAAKVEVSGTSAQPTVVEAVPDANLTVSAPNATQTVI